MTDHCRCANPRTDRIRTLNDAFRSSLSGGSVMVTRAVTALGAEAQREILAALRRYDEFDADNDPYGDHDFGRITVQGQSYSKSIITTRISCGIRQTRRTQL